MAKKDKKSSAVEEAVTETMKDIKSTSAGMCMGVNKRHVGFGMRTWRYVMYVDDMEIVYFSQEDGMNNDGSDDDPYVKTKPQVVLDWFDTTKE